MTKFRHYVTRDLKGLRVDGEDHVNWITYFEHRQSMLLWTNRHQLPWPATKSAGELGLDGG